MMIWINRPRPSRSHKNTSIAIGKITKISHGFIGVKFYVMVATDLEV